MAKNNLETRVKKSVLKIEKNISGIYDILTDFSLKFCHIIERMGDEYKYARPTDYNDGQ
jgi:hypothetical protein